jgi:hypothetical protein
VTVSYPTITDVATEARPYPTHLLEKAPRCLHIDRLAPLSVARQEEAALVGIELDRPGRTEDREFGTRALAL